ncbi:MAG: hypothetical protein AAF804_11425, partial [Bacteroidota bacterium]
FIAVNEKDPYTVLSHYPQNGRMGDLVYALLKKGGYTGGNPYAYLNGFTLERAYLDGDQLHVQSSMWSSFYRLFGYRQQQLSFTLTISLSSATALRWRWYETLPLAYHRGGALILDHQANFDAAVTIGDQLFVFRGNQFSITDEIPDSLSSFTFEAESQTIEQAWRWQKVDAAYHFENKTYLFSKDHYFRLVGDEEPNSLPTSQVIAGNWGNIPDRFKGGMDAALIRNQQLFFFSGDEYLAYDLETNTYPYEIGDSTYDIIRLTTGTAGVLNTRLFSEELAGFLGLATQEVDERPYFSATHSKSDTIQYNSSRINELALPIESHLDFNSANGIYYWEMFFHAPFLIAQSLNTGQKFELAKQWYEYIFDPTEAGNYWKFLPFITQDVWAIVAGIRQILSDLKELSEAASLTSEIEAIFEGTGEGDPLELGDPKSIFLRLERVEDVFQGQSDFVLSEEEDLAELSDLSFLLGKIEAYAGLEVDQDIEEYTRSWHRLRELTLMIERLSALFDNLKNTASQLSTYLDDPFDPHAIAHLRKIAYRKALVMRYIDNLIDWGDMLFTQYTIESINEARQLYILAYDLLGRRPVDLGYRQLSDTQTYDDLQDPGNAYDFLLFLENELSVDTSLNFAGKSLAQVHENITQHPYFYLPENELFIEYWDRVEDRLYKIRHCLNILGVKQPLPLFQPPIDPMALVQAASSGAGLSQGLAGLGIAIPHYRFSFMARKAQELVGKLNQFGGELLAALEKKDAEELSMLQGRQEMAILRMTLEVRQAQEEDAKA